MSRTRYCEACGDATGGPDLRYCGRCSCRKCIHCTRVGQGEVCEACLSLLADLGEEEEEDSTEANGGNGGSEKSTSNPSLLPSLPPVRSSSLSLSPRPRSGPWLAWAAEVRGLTAWFEAYGQARGWPRRIDLWSVGMVGLAINARMLVPTTTKGAAR